MLYIDKIILEYNYLDSLFIKYYGIYLRLYDEKQKQNVYKKNLIPKIY